MTSKRHWLFAGDGKHPAVAVPAPAGALAAQRGRLDKAMPVGNEVVGWSSRLGISAAQALVGRVVGFLSGNAYAQYRTLHVTQRLLMADGTDPADAAAAFVNPLTASGNGGDHALQGHTALVHTVGASNLGLMLNRICLDDGVGLVNIVRKPEHVRQLRALGAQHVVDSSADGFVDDLTDALRATGQRSCSTRSAAATWPAFSCLGWRRWPASRRASSAATGPTPTSRSTSTAGSTGADHAAS